MKRGKHPTTKRRAKRQSTKRRYARAREDAQLEGLIPTEPAEALKPERVNPSEQSEQPLPGLIGQAMRRGWAVPEEKKPALVDELEQIVHNPEVSPVPKVMAYQALIRGDQMQYARDYPDEAGKAQGGVQVGVGVQVGMVDPFALYQRLMQEAQEDEVERAISLPPENLGGVESLDGRGGTGGEAG